MGAIGRREEGSWKEKERKRRQEQGEDDKSAQKRVRGEEGEGGRVRRIEGIVRPPKGQG